MKIKREMGFFDALMMGLTGAIGFEIFILMDYPFFNLELGAGIVFALFLAGLANILIMLNYCELCTAIPEVGGSYTYIKAAYEGFIPFILGCFRWLASVFGAALAAVVFADQLLYLLQVTPIPESPVAPQSILVSITVVTIAAAVSIRQTKRLGTTIVLAFIVLFAIFIGGGLMHGLAGSVEVLPKNLPGDLPRVFAATVYMFPMFFGVRSLIAGAAKVKEPGRNLPRAILLSVFLIIPLYLCIAYVATGTIPLDAGGGEGRLLNVAAQTVFDWPGGVLVAVAGMVASFSALGTSLTVQSSILQGMSRDGYLPKFLSSLHLRFRTPYLALIVGSLFVVVLSATGAVVFLTYAMTFGSMIVFAAVSLCLLKLRKEKPYMERPFRTPLYPFTPIAGFIISVSLLLFPLLRDFDAARSLLSVLGVTGLVLATYYLRMIGRNRLRVAVGGVGLGVGVLLALFAYLVESGFGYAMLFISGIVCVVGAYAILRG